MREARPGEERAIHQVVTDVPREFDFETEPDGVDAVLRDIQVSYSARGGTFLVLVDEADRVGGCGGVYPLDSEIAEVRKMYFRPDVRGTERERLAERCDRAMELSL